MDKSIDTRLRMRMYNLGIHPFIHIYCVICAISVRGKIDSQVVEFMHDIEASTSAVESGIERATGPEEYLSRWLSKKLN